MSDITLETIISCIAESTQLSRESIEPDSLLSSIPQWDSLSALTLLSRLEEEFKLTIDPSTLFACATTREIAEIICGT
jgi:acyl carrier protein